MKRGTMAWMLVGTVIAGLVTPASGWGPEGHRVVGLIAERHLDDAAMHQVRLLLGPRTLADVSTWADTIRGDPAWAHAAPWHYINVADTADFATLQRNPDGDVWEAMERYEQVLRDPQAERRQREIALKFLVHFVGDVHMPLHVGRSDDLGGNRRNVTWFGEPTNLHRVWDSGILARRGSSAAELSVAIDDVDPRTIGQWQATGYVDWMEESRRLRVELYAESNHFRRKADRKLGEAYVRKNLPRAERRLAQAGIRLAGLLNSVFAD